MKEKNKIKNKDINLVTESVVKFSFPRYRSYGVETIENRALPDYRDGLKPVHRRILWAMYKMGLHYSGNFKKAARISGETLGKFHPHGSLSVDDAMVGLTNTSETQNVPVGLIEGQGNWGAYNAGAAASRYCFTGETRVTTEYGLIPIKDLQNYGKKIDDKKVDLEVNVVSRDNETLQTLYWIDSGIQNITRLIFRDGTMVRCTDNEPFLTLNTELEYEWVTAKNLTRQHIVCISRDHKSIDPKGGQELKNNNTNLPTNMSIELARLLGYIVASNGTGFVNSDRELIEDYIECWNKVFPNFELTSTKIPNGKTIPYWMTCSTEIYDFLLSLGLTRTCKVVPEIIFTSSKEEVSHFLRAYFESSGSCSKFSITASSKSIELLRGIKELLHGYFGIPSLIPSIKKTKGKAILSIIYHYNLQKFKKEIGFISKRKIKKFNLNESYTGNISTNDKLYYHDSIPFFIRDYIRDFLESHRINTYSLFNENKDVLHYMSLEGLWKVPLKNEAFKDWFIGVKPLLKEHYPTLHNKLDVIYKCNYFYTKFSKNKFKTIERKRQRVYDLTVPCTHAFTVCGGLIVHNTEGKLSLYSDQIMLDKSYLAVSKMISNYDGSEKEPLILPSLLPTIFLNGTFGIAVGVKTGIPPFKLEGVIKLTKMALQGKKITPNLCLKYLKFNFPYHPVLVSDNTVLLDYYKTGKGNIIFRNDYTINIGTKSAVINGVVPGFNEEKVLDKLMKIDEIKSARCCSSKNIEILVELKDTIPQKNATSILTNIMNGLKSTVQCQTNVTIRKVAGLGTEVEEVDADFMETTIPDMFNDWVLWRIILEADVLKHLRAVAEERVKYLKLLEYAITKLDIIFAILRSKIKDLDEELSKKLKITLEEAKIILALQVRRLSKLSDTEIKTELKKLYEEISSLKKDQKDPASRIIRNIDTINTSKYNVIL